MEKEFIIQVAGIIIGGLGTLLLALLIWGLKSLISAVLKTSTELAIIKNQLSSLIEDTKSIHKIKEDINALHGKIRDIKSPADTDYFVIRKSETGLDYSQQIKDARAAARLKVL